MDWANVKNMVVPDIGLKDGMLQALFEEFFDEISESPVHPAKLPVPDVQNRPLGID
jgi:exopolyphosphatase/guanosine-5'-triphosphate,3'-diphosphate pyrophosphatase